MSLPGLTRQSIFLRKILSGWMRGSSQRMKGNEAHADDRRRRLPDADAVEFAGLQFADVGAADALADAAVPRHPLRPPRPRQIAGAARSLFDGALWPRRAGGPRRSQHRE